MAHKDEAILATLLGVIAKNQRFLQDTQTSLNLLAEGMGRTAPETVVNVPEPKVIASPVDMAPLQSAMEANTKQLAAMTNAILATITQPKIEWEVDIIRDAVNGSMKKLKFKPARENMN